MVITTTMRTVWRRSVSVQVTGASTFSMFLVGAVKQGGHFG